MKKILTLTLLISLIAACKKDEGSPKEEKEKDKEELSCVHFINFLKKPASASFEVSVMSGLYNQMTAVFTPINENISRMDIRYTGIFSANFEDTLYYYACGSKLYHATQENLSDTTLFIDLNTPVNQLYDAKLYNFILGYEENVLHKIVDKSHKFTIGDNQYYGYKILTLVEDEGKYVEMGYQIFNPEFGITAFSSINESRHIISYE